MVCSIFVWLFFKATLLIPFHRIIEHREGGGLSWGSCRLSQPDLLWADFYWNLSASEPGGKRLVCQAVWGTEEGGIYHRRAKTPVKTNVRISGIKVAANVKGIGQLFFSKDI